LPGITDVSEAVAEIGRTPLLEFKLVDQDALFAQDNARALEESFGTSSGAVVGNINVDGQAVDEMEPYIDTGLTGRYLETAALEFASGQTGQLSNEPIVSVRFTSEGADLFADITRANVGEQLAIFLDGEVISAPTINEAIVGGTAIISGGFTPDEAKELSDNLKLGALPVPIELQSTQTIGASLGAEVLEKGMVAAVVGLSLIIAFMMFWYRLPGLVAGLALLSYVTIMLALFQYIPVTLTAAGLAGFIISLGMAVDANVLVFERLKEEYNNGADSREAAIGGFSKAWSAIRDGNITSLLSAIILFWFGTSMVKGFALVFGIGVIVSMLSALLITRTLLIALPAVKKDSGGVLSLLFGSGLKK
jgi:preprotein translocase subunit SecD